MTKYVWVGILAGLVACWRPAAADQATIDDDAIQRAFHPYPIEKPAPPSPRTRGRPRKTPYPRRFWTRSRQASSPSTSRRRPIRGAYINATQRYAAQVRPGDNGELPGYVAGQPQQRTRPRPDRRVHDRLRKRLRLADRGLQDRLQPAPARRLLPVEPNRGPRPVGKHLDRLLSAPSIPLSLRERGMGKKRLDRRNFEPTSSRPERQGAE